MQIAISSPAGSRLFYRLRSARAAGGLRRPPARNRLRHRRRPTGLFQQDLAQRLINFTAPARPRAAWRARGYHELLKVRPLPPGVHAAVDDIHAGHRQQVGADAAQITIQRQLRQCAARRAAARETPSRALAPIGSCSRCRPARSAGGLSPLVGAHPLRAAPR